MRSRSASRSIGSSSPMPIPTTSTVSSSSSPTSSRTRPPGSLRPRSKRARRSIRSSKRGSSRSTVWPSPSPSTSMPRPMSKSSSGCPRRVSSHLVTSSTPAITFHGAELRQLAGHPRRGRRNARGLTRRARSRFPPVPPSPCSRTWSTTCRPRWPSTSLSTMPIRSSRRCAAYPDRPGANLLEFGVGNLFPKT